MAKNDEELTLALGLMSGTSCDGVDAALIETDGDGTVRAVASHFRPYNDHERTVLKQALIDARGLDDRTARPGVLAEAEGLVTAAHCEAVAELLALDNVAGRQPDVIGFHGQTVWHDPDAHVTVQIGDGQALANTTGFPVVYDLRAADVAAGGQGAPLVPIYHKALFSAEQLPLPCAVINIGGVANVTWISNDGSLVAFDSGPGNALLDDWVGQHSDKKFDDGGRLAAVGQVDFLALITLMGHPYFKKRAPKSLDRNAFNLDAISLMALEDGAATLTAFTVETICLGLEHMEQMEGQAAQVAIVCGGGQRNAHMMGQLADALEMPVMGADQLGWRGDMLEAEAFAYLAVRSQKGLPITFPGTTGVKEPMTGGLLAEPSE